MQNAQQSVSVWGAGMLMVFLLFLLFLIPVAAVVQAQHPTPTPSPAFVLAVRDGNAQGPPAVLKLDGLFPR
jgi:Na+-transporting methylmalonyl-CoA/oxaloacetate decarboxylase gamma subunit